MISINYGGNRVDIFSIPTFSAIKVSASFLYERVRYIHTNICAGKIHNSLFIGILNTKILNAHVFNTQN